MENLFLLSLTFFALCFSKACHGDVLFSSLPEALLVTASPQQGQVLQAGDDKLTVAWGLNQSQLRTPGADNSFSNVKVKLCYAPTSQRDRAWRKTVDNLSKDKTCQFTIVNRLYDFSQANQSFEWVIENDVPTATYFMRAYAYNSAGEEVAFGQTTDAKKNSNLFEINGISGSHRALDIASICFSAFSLVSLFGFILVERDRNKRGSKN